MNLFWGRFSVSPGVASLSYMERLPSDFLNPAIDKTDTCGLDQFSTLSIDSEV